MDEEAREISKKYTRTFCEEVNIPDITASAEFLQQNNFTTEQILSRVKCLSLSKDQLENRLNMLEEFKFTKVEILFMTQFLSLIQKTVVTMKNLKLIEENVKVADELAQRFDIPIVPPPNIKDSMSLVDVKDIMMKLYLNERLQLNSKEVDKFILRNRSIKTTVEVIKIFKNQLEFSDKFIANHIFLLQANPENIKSILNEIPRIGNSTIQDLIRKTPRILLQKSQNLFSIIQSLEKFGIPLNDVEKYPRVLVMNHEGVYKRLVMMKDTEEFEILLNHPRALQLLLSHTKASERLKQLKQMKVDSASLYVMSSASAFDRFSKLGIDTTIGKDTVYYVSKALKMEQDKVRKVLTRHPNWSHVAPGTAKKCLEYLKYQKFSIEDIKENVMLLLYPVSRVTPKLNELLELRSEQSEFAKQSDLNLSGVSDSKLLNLCLYFVESEFGFTGDGIWDSNRQEVKHDPLPATMVN